MNFLTKLTAFFFLGWLVAAVAFGAPTPTPTPGDEKFRPMVIDGFTCGEFAHLKSGWTWRNCPQLERFLSARVKFLCTTTGDTFEMACPGGATRVETVPR